MTSRHPSSLPLLLLLLLLLAPSPALSTTPTPTATPSSPPSAITWKACMSSPTLVSVLWSTRSHPRFGALAHSHPRYMGTVKFAPSFSRNRPTALRCGVLISVDLQHVEPVSSYHGFHVHAYGDVRAVLSDGASTGGHFGNDSQVHAYPYQAGRHWGDLGNVKADAKGRVVLERVDIHSTTALFVGRGVTVHEGRDKGNDFPPSGAAGKRIAVGTVGYANLEWEEMIKEEEEKKNREGDTGM